jgi:hypothetical protein
MGAQRAVFNDSPRGVVVTPTREIIQKDPNDGSRKADCSIDLLPDSHHCLKKKTKMKKVKQTKTKQKN